MENVNTIPAHIQRALDGIDDNAMAISGISRLIYALKLDSDNLMLDKEGSKLYPGLERLKSGLDDCSIMRSIEVMAEDIKVHIDRIEMYLHDGGAQWRQQMEAEIMKKALAQDAAQ